MQDQCIKFVDFDVIKVSNSERTNIIRTDIDAGRDKTDNRLRSSSAVYSYT